MSKKHCDMEQRLTDSINVLIPLRDVCRQYKQKNWGAAEAFYQYWIDRKIGNEQVDIVTFATDNKFYMSSDNYLCVRSFGDETSSTGEIHWKWFPRYDSFQKYPVNGIWRRIDASGNLLYTVNSNC